MTWETVIGLEVHTQLNTDSKIFSGSSTAYGAEPNCQANIVDLGLPGVLPVFNERALHLAIKFGLSVQADISQRSVFARKNYFYPDLSKGYQISQLDAPIVSGGSLTIHVDNQKKVIPLTRAHLEEDAGKSVHAHTPHASGIDYNRAGTPLLEIVSEPAMRSAKEAVAYLKTLHQLVRYLKISDGNMQEGSFRCDVNISVRRQGEEKLDTRTEIKNVNSFRFVEQAILFEQDRQIDVLENGGIVIQETRQYDANKNITKSMRSKENAFDYRYFPDPDLLPVNVDETLLADIRSELPELPEQKRQRYFDEYQLSDEDIQGLTRYIDTALYFEKTLACMTHSHPKLAANWINGEWLSLINKHHSSITEQPIAAEQLAQLLDKIQDKTLSTTMGKQVLSCLWADPQKTVDHIIKEQGLEQLTDTTAIAAIVDDVLAQHPEQVEQFKQGKDKVFGFLVGQAMKASKGKANPSDVNKLLREQLNAMK